MNMPSIYEVELLDLVLSNNGAYKSNGSYKIFTFNSKEQALSEFESRKKELANDYTMIKANFEETGKLPQYTEGVAYSEWAWSNVYNDLTEEVEQINYMYDTWERV